MALQIATAGTGIVRDAHFVTPTGASSPVRTLLLEPQRTNLCIRSEEFDNASWAKTNCTITANATTAPDGTTTADLATATGASGRFSVPMTFTGDGEKCAAIWLRAGTAATSTVSIADATTGFARHRVLVTWTAGVPSLTTDSGAGTRYPVESYGNGWYRIRFSATGVVAANVNIMQIVVDAAGTTGTVLAWGAQAENAVVPSSYIPTGATTVTRNADSLYWDIPALVPQEMTVYVRGVSVGAYSLTPSGTRVAAIGNAAQTGAAFRIGRIGATANVFATYNDGTTTVVATAVPSPSIALFDVVEHRGVLSSSLVATCGISVNGGTEVTANSTASGPAAAFAESRFWLAGVTDHNVTAVTHVAIARGTKSRAEMRAIAGVP